MIELLIAVVAGLFIGLSLGALGGGGSILAVPILVYALGQSGAEATTGSLIVVGATAAIGTATAWRAGNVELTRGVGFGALGIAGAALGARASAAVSDEVLLACFAALMVVVGVLMAVRQLRGRQESDRQEAEAPPVLRLRPSLQVHVGQLTKMFLAASAVGVLTGFLGVGGGFLVVPALVLVLGMPMRQATGTSLLVIVMTSAAALLVRVGIGVEPVWDEVLTLTGAAALGAVFGARIADRANPTTLSAAFTLLVLVVAGYTGAQSLPALL